MKPRLFEALMAKQDDQREVYEKLKQKAEHPFLKRYSTWALKKASLAIGKRPWRMHDTMVDAAWPELIGRNIITVMPTMRQWNVFHLTLEQLATATQKAQSARLSGKETLNS